MDLTLTSEQELIQRTARELLEARSPMSHMREMETDSRGYAADLWKEMVELGWMGLALPEEHGGLGQSFLELCLLIEELGRHQTPSPFVGTVVHGALPIARFGTEEQKKAFLGPIAAGTKIMSYADGRGSLAAQPDGDDYVLGGDAMFVPYAHAANQLLIVAQHGDQAIVGLVDADSPGIVCERLDTVRPDHEYRILLDGVLLSKSRILGDVHSAPAVIETIEALGAAAACAEMVGGAQRVLDMTVGYASDRTQFGRPVGSFQAVQHHCANMAIDVLGSRFIAYEAIWSLSEGLDASLEVSLAKAWVGEAYRRVCALGHQVHGAIGFTHEYDLHYYYRHAMSAEVTFGDTDEHLDHVARQIGL